MRWLGAGIVLAMVVATPLSVSAQNVISAHEVLEVARAHHPRILVDTARIRAATGELLAARGAFDPVLRASADAQRGGAYESTRFDVAVEQPIPIAGATLSLGYRLADGDIPVYYGERDTLERGEVRAGIRVPLMRDLVLDDARAQRARAAFDVDLARATLEANVLALQRDALLAFYRYVAARRVLDVANAVYRLALDRDGQLERLVATGALAPIERLENERAVLARRARVRVAEQRVQQAALLLSLFLRDEQGQPTVLTPTTLFEVPEPVTEAYGDVGAALDAARARRPELRRYALLLDRAALDRSLARNTRRPRVDLRLSTSRDLGEGPNELSGTILEAGVSIVSAVPNRTGRGREQARRADVAGLEAELQLFEETLAVDVTRALLDLRVASELVAIEREAARVADELATAERRRFEEGGTSMLFVNLREQTAADARIAVIEREAEALMARAIVDALVGDFGMSPLREP